MEMDMFQIVKLCDFEWYVLMISGDEKEEEKRKKLKLTQQPRSKTYGYHSITMQLEHLAVTHWKNPSSNCCCPPPHHYNVKSRRCIELSKVQIGCKKFFIGNIRVKREKERSSLSSMPSNTETDFAHQDRATANHDSVRVTFKDSRWTSTAERQKVFFSATFYLAVKKPNYWAQAEKARVCLEKRFIILFHTIPNIGDTIRFCKVRRGRQEITHLLVVVFSREV